MQGVSGRARLKLFSADGKTYSSNAASKFNKDCERYGLNPLGKNGQDEKSNTSLSELKSFIDTQSGVAYVIIESSDGALSHWVSLNRDIQLQKLKDPSDYARFDSLFESVSRLRVIASVVSNYSGTDSGASKLSKVKKPRKAEKPRVYDKPQAGTVKVDYTSADSLNNGQALFFKEGMTAPLKLDYVNQDALDGGHTKALSAGEKSVSVLEYFDEQTVKHILVTYSTKRGYETFHIAGVSSVLRQTLYTRIEKCGKHFDLLDDILRGFVGSY